MTKRLHTIRSFLCLLTLIAALLNGSLAVAQQTPLPGLDSYIKEALTVSQSPGVAIAIVKDDKVVLAKGYGVRKAGDTALVDERTIFSIGSVTKSFTAASLGMLVDEGKLKWDDPVTSHLRDFQLYDPYVTREITVRDLLCHRSGLDRADQLWDGTSFDRTEVLRRLRYQKPAWAFRSHFGYNNIMFLAAGQIIPAVTGKSWDDFVRERIFVPLGMNATGTGISTLKQRNDVATPHLPGPDGVRPTPWNVPDRVAPAGAIYSNVIDMAQWLRLQLGNGSYGDQKLLSLGVVEEMHNPQMTIQSEGGYAVMAPDAHFLSYGFGWVLSDYHGRKVISHGGNISGMTAMAGMLPEENLGVIVLSNLDHSGLPWALMYRVFDAYLGLPAQDWNARMMTVMHIRELGEQAEASRVEAARVKNTKPSLSMSEYAGTYANDLYGEVTVTEVKGEQRLLFHYNDTLSGELNHWHYDTFHLKWVPPGMGEAFVTFTLNAQGKVDEMKVQKFADFKRISPGVK